MRKSKKEHNLTATGIQSNRADFQLKHSRSFGTWRRRSSASLLKTTFEKNLTTNKNLLKYCYSIYRIETLIDQYLPEVETATCLITNQKPDYLIGGWDRAWPRSISASVQWCNRHRMMQFLHSKCWNNEFDDFFSFNKSNKNAHSIIVYAKVISSYYDAIKKKAKF